MQTNRCFDSEWKYVGSKHKHSQSDCLFSKRNEARPLRAPAADSRWSSGREGRGERGMSERNFISSRSYLATALNSLLCFRFRQNEQK